MDNVDARLNETEPTGVTALDLTQCEREPIRIPGSVQPHGVLLVLTALNMIVVSVSANSERHLGLMPKEMIGRPLVELIGAEAFQMLRESLARPDDAGHHGTDVRFGSNGSRWTGVAHAQGHLVLLELEPPRPTMEGDSALVLVGAAAKRMQAATSDTEACEIAAQQVRRITGFDRVKVYRFASDWSGEVVGEARDPAMASYLGLHFPPSDIPAQARTLYQTNPMRLIAQVDYTPSPLVPDHDPSTGAPFDLSQAVLRSVSPIHLEYMRNMEVSASMSVSILKSSALEGSSLWGLIACHHRKPLHVGFEVRQACELVAQVLSWQLGVMERIETAARFGKVKTLHANLLGKAFSGFSVAEGLARKGEAALDIVDATGFAMVTPEGVTRVGKTPDESFIADLANWLVIPDRSDFFATDRLPVLFPPAIPKAYVAAGLLAVPLSRPQRSFLLWFRPELSQTVTWAGEPMKAVRQEAGEIRLQPRQSFAAWTEEVRFRSAPWTSSNLATAVESRELVLELTIGERDSLERQNLQLVRSNQELETFIYVAAHDIKEPLRQMEMLADMIRNCAATNALPEADEYLVDFRRLGKRLRTLTEELADYAKLSRSDNEFLPVDLGEVAEEVVALLQGAIDRVGGTVVVGSLPTVNGERAQLHQVFLNLAGNALKYRDKSRPLRIVISEVTRQGNESIVGLAEKSTQVRVEVKDNGIGFDPKYSESVFDAFMRLHSKDRFEGSGLGLAICRRIAERHGGRLEAMAEPNVGASFTLILPRTLPK